MLMNKLELLRKKCKNRDKNNNNCQLEEMLKKIMKEEGKEKDKEVATITKRNKHKTKSDTQAVKVDQNPHHPGRHRLQKVDN